MCPGFLGAALLGFRPRVGWCGVAVRTLSAYAFPGQSAGAGVRPAGLVPGILGVPEPITVPTW